MPLESKGMDKSKSGANQQKKTIILISCTVVCAILMVLVYIKLGIIKLGSSPEVPAVASTPSSQSNTTVSNTSSSATTTATFGTADNKNISNTSVASNGGNTSKNQNNHPLANPFGGPYKLLGVIVNPTGINVAIIDNNSKQIAVSEKDLLDDFWIVDSVALNKVILKYADRTITLNMQ